jgi:hypothetical protein
VSSQAGYARTFHRKFRPVGRRALWDNCHIDHWLTHMQLSRFATRTTYDCSIKAMSVIIKRKVRERMVEFQNDRAPERCFSLWRFENCGATTCAAS